VRVHVGSDHGRTLNVQTSRLCEGGGSCAVHGVHATLVVSTYTSMSRRAGGRGMVRISDSCCEFLL
jgi:hypothetical protein